MAVEKQAGLAFCQKLLERIREFFEEKDDAPGYQLLGIAQTVHSILEAKKDEADDSDAYVEGLRYFLDEVIDRLSPLEDRYGGMFMVLA